MKKHISIFLFIIIFILNSILCVNSETSYNLTALNNCDYLYTYNSSNACYFYGYNINTLYSAKVLPEVDIFYVSVDGKIRSVCHNNNYAYALYEDYNKDDNFYIVKMNMSNGNCNYYNIGYYPKLRKTSFSVSNNEIFLINTDIHTSYVMSLDFNGNRKYNYQFDVSVTRVFINDENVYAHLYGGEIYKLNNGTYTLFGDAISKESVCNAGAGYIYTDENSLYSISDNYSRTYYTNFNCIVKNGSIYYADGNRLKTSEGKNYKMPDDIIAIVSSKDSIAVLLSNYSCRILNKSELNAKAPSLNNNPNIDSYYYIDNVLYGIECGTNVSDFKKSFSNNVNVYDTDNSTVTSGKMKTGYNVSTGDTNYYIAVQGDITGEGNVNSKDVSSIMSFLSGATELKGEFYYSADFNYDENVDNRDMVLIAQKYENEK